MKIIIDNREHALIPLIQSYVDNEKTRDKIAIQIQTLDIGDIHIIDDNNQLVLIIERKTVADLASSISDGRYNEQSFRLNSTNIHNHNIYYIIEGNITSYKPYRSRITTNAIYSSIFTLSYYKGFSVFKTDNTHETAKMIVKITDKLYRESSNGKKSPFYNTSEAGTSTSVADTSTSEAGIADSIAIDYANTLKTQKKSFITKDNIAKIMLMQIPNVSSNSADIITNKYKTIIDLICALQEDECCLDNLSYITNTGKNRKINKPCIKNIKEFLLNED